MRDNPKIVFFGAGAIGGSVGGWVAAHHANTYFVDRGEVADAMRRQGICLYQQGQKDALQKVTVNVINSLSEASDADVVVLAVKNYSLDAVSRIVQEALGDRPMIVAMQNGVENQTILPRYFSKVIYCVVGYNAWIDDDRSIGYQKKGPLIFGTARGELQSEMQSVAAVFNKGVETVVVDHLGDAAYSKMIINLTNSLTTLVGHGFRPISDPALFQKLLTNLLLEGVQIAKAAGHHECKIGGMPPWSKIWMGARLPRFLTKGMFERNTRKMVISSMAQDVIQRGGHESELESINGEFLRLAEQHGVRSPFNGAIYALCKVRFAAPKFEPMDVIEVWAAVQSGHALPGQAR